VWSNWAVMAVAMLVLAGAAQALIEVGTVAALLHSTYGKLLLAKVGLLAVVLAVATVSHRLVLRAGRAGDRDPVGGLDPGGEPGATRPLTSVGSPAAGSLAGESPAVGSPTVAGGADDPAAPVRRVVPRLRRTVLAELVGAVLLVGLTAVLVQTAPARSVTETNAGAGVVAATLTNDLYQLQFDVAPARTGTNEVHLYAYTPQGVPLKVIAWAGAATPVAGGTEPQRIILVPLTDSHAVGTVLLNTAGAWRLSFTLQVSKFDEATVTTTVSVG